MISEIILALEDSCKGYAKICGDVMTIYLPTLTRLLSIPREFFPFPTIEELIEELTIHELIHKITGVIEDETIDSWHMLECRVSNGREKCDCPIDCFFRDRLCVGNEVS